MTTEYKEYIVKLLRSEDLADFYDDMETPGGNLYIPDRVVQVSLQKPQSNVIRYYLSEQEAALVAQDPRVEYVRLSSKELPVRRGLQWQQSADFWRGSYSSGTTTKNGPTGLYQNTDKNWGLHKVITGNNYWTLPNTDPAYQWGSGNGTFRRLPDSIGTILDGNGVDVVIIDGHLRANHAEFRANTDGTGALRTFGSFNWFQYAINNPTNTNVRYVHHTQAVGQSYNYAHTGQVQGADDHGTHVAGTVAGNTQGFARQANIYNISIFDDTNNYNISPLVYDYIRAFHANKTLDPATGKRRPTIVNASIGATIYFDLSEIIHVVYRGVTYTGTWDSTGVTNNGVTTLYHELGMTFNKESVTSPYTGNPSISMPFAYDSDELADIDSMIDEGIIFVCAAGNDNWTQDVSGGQDYNNYIRVSRDLYGLGNPTTDYYYSRRTGVQTSKTITVANANHDAFEYLAGSSNRGNVITITAPGTSIISAVGITSSAILDGSGAQIGTRLSDPRNQNNDKLEPYNGTSMASPHVAGVLALLAQANPDITNPAAISYLTAKAKTGQLNDFQVGTTNGYRFGLKNTPNRYLHLPALAVSAIPDQVSVSPSQTVTFTITATHFPDNSTIYWTTTGTAMSSDFADSLMQGSAVVTSQAATVTRQMAGAPSPSANFSLQLRTGSYTGNIHFTTQTITVNSPTTQPPTTQSPTTQPPTTQSPTTQSPTTQSPTTQSPTTQSPTTQSPTTQSPTTQSPTTQSPTTQSPTTQSPTTQSPTTQSPTTQSPTTQSPTTQSPTTQAPGQTTQSPTTQSPTTQPPTTAGPTTTRAPRPGFFVATTTTTTQSPYVASSTDQPLTGDFYTLSSRTIRINNGQGRIRLAINPNSIGKDRSITVTLANGKSVKIIVKPDNS